MTDGAMPIELVVVLNDFCHAQGGASRVAISEAIALQALGVQVHFSAPLARSALNCWTAACE